MIYLTKIWDKERCVQGLRQIGQFIGNFFPTFRLLQNVGCNLFLVAIMDYNGIPQQNFDQFNAH